MTSTKNIMTAAVVSTALACLLTSGSILFYLHHTTLESHKKELTHLVLSSASLIKAAARLLPRDATGGPSPSDARLLQAASAIVNQSGGALTDFGDTGEFTLAERQNQDMVFLMRFRQDRMSSDSHIPFNNHLAEPMKHALAGETGTIIGPDYSGRIVVAAYTGLGSSIGLVAKMDLSEIEAPFYRIAVVAGLACLAAICLSAFVVQTRLGPLSKQMKEKIAELAAKDEALARSEQYYKDLFENNSAIKLLIDKATGSIIDANSAAEAFYGFPRETLLKKTIYDFNTMEEYAVNASMENAATSRNRHFDFTHKTAHGLRHVEVYSGKVESSFGTRLFSIIHDVTDKVEAWRNLMESERRYRTTFELSQVGIAHISLNGSWISVNQALCRLLGYERHELMQKSVTDVVFPEDRESLLALNHDLVFGPPGGCGVKRRYRAKNGQEIHAMLNAALVRDFADHPEYLIHVISDVTDLEKSRALLVQNNAKLQTAMHRLDEFAFIVSHDLREPLRGLSNYAQMLAEEYGSSLNDDARDMLETMVKLARRQEDMIMAVLHYSRVNNAEFTPGSVDLEHALDIALADLASLLERYPTTIRRNNRLPVVVGDEALLVEVFKNLIANAIKFNNKSERWVEVDGMHAESGAFVAMFGERGSGVAVLVRDNGFGIDPEFQETIFGFFKRLHGKEEYGGGSGLGLTIVKRIVERHGGRVGLLSEPGHGSTFYFTLPE
ncbi:sensor histidine kinase [Desulfovibrio inopinatus]|uniref:sensor histidine kinase n=1 Tax=Desulfovibrio inopinatus TaxID=102109 RepID=UPI000403830D|nr:PAS domain S-box protein [Desulfovibrio inopinatus]